MLDIFVNVSLICVMNWDNQGGTSLADVDEDASLACELILSSGGESLGEVGLDEESLSKTYDFSENFKKYFSLVRYKWFLTAFFFVFFNH